MPTYQYACTACDERLEAVQSFSDAPLTECPACGGALRKVFSAVGVVFKGSGFYKTDSRAKSTSSSGTDSKAAEGKTEGRAEGKAEGKAGGKAETTTDNKSASTTASTPAASTPASKTA